MRYSLTPASEDASSTYCKPGDVAFVCFIPFLSILPFAKFNLVGRKDDRHLTFPESESLFQYAKIVADAAIKGKTLFLYYIFKYKSQFNFYKILGVTFGEREREGRAGGTHPFRKRCRLS